MQRLEHDATVFDLQAQVLIRQGDWIDNKELDPSYSRVLVVEAHNVVLLLLGSEAAFFALLEGLPEDDAVLYAALSNENDVFFVGQHLNATSFELFDKRFDINVKQDRERQPPYGMPFLIFLVPLESSEVLTWIHFDTIRSRSIGMSRTSRQSLTLID